MYQFSNTLNAIVKPTLACNLRCKYCYYQHTNYDSQKMSIETLKKFCDITFPHFKQVLIVWHGGEPTICSEKRLIQYIEIVKEKSKEYNLKNIQQNIQTNGTNLSDNLVKHFKFHNISVGISYDGLKNEYLRYSTKKVQESMLIIKKYKLPTRAIAVISNVNCDNLISEYEHFKTNQINVKFSPYEDIDSFYTNLKISSKKYSENMKKLFQYWINDKNCYIRVDPFCSMICDYFNGFSSLCSRNSCMKRWVGINPNGDIYPCGKLTNITPYGNVNNLDDIREIYNSKSFLFLLEKSIIRREKCKNNCEIYKFCEGGCNYDAMRTSGIENNDGFDCQIFKELFTYIINFVDKQKLFQHLECIKNPVLFKSLQKLNKKVTLRAF